jgi:hypothetical protein
MFQVSRRKDTALQKFRQTKTDLSGFARLVLSAQIQAHMNMPVIASIRSSCAFAPF